MNIRHSLSFPLRPNETATSYASNLARYCGLSTPNDLCLDHGFRWQDLVRGDDAHFDKIATIGGARADDMKRWSVRTVSRNHFAVSGQSATKISLARTRLRVCPHCLEEDRKSEGKYGPYRRNYWQLYSIRTCARHGVNLITLPQEKHTLANYDFMGCANRHWDHVIACSDTSAFRAETPFERYIRNRLDGAKQDNFLSAYPLNVATRLCEALGHAMMYGEHAKFSSATQNELWTAGQMGFEAVTAHPDGLVKTLDSLRTATLNTMRHRRDFGAFYQWLRSAVPCDPVERLKDTVREYIFESYPIPEGYEVLGKPCPKQLIYTIHSARLELGMHRDRINRYLTTKGAAVKEDASKQITLNKKFSLTDIEAIAAESHQRVEKGEATEILGISEGVLYDLCNLGIIQRSRSSLEHISKYDRTELSELLAHLDTHAIANGSSATSLTPIRAISGALHVKISQIVKLILDGAVAHVSGDISDAGINALHLDADEIRGLMFTGQEAGLTLERTCKVLRIPLKSIHYLVDQGLLVSGKISNPKSRKAPDGIFNSSITRFLNEYETLGRLAKRYRRMPGPFFKQLESRGVCPIETPVGIGCIYEKRSLDDRIKRAGISIPRDG